MDFRKYNSIENSYQQKFVEKSFYNLDGYNDFIVQEKIHGANFAFYVSENWIKCAKRTGFILEWEDFFNYDKVLEDNSFSLIELQKEIGDCIVFGELFGGSVQKEVFYCTEKKFYAFDIIVDWNYLTVDECVSLFDKHGFLYAKVLKRGTMQECFEYDVNQNSLLASELSPELPKYLNGVNIMEGVVIRPNESKFIGESRIIFKKKTEWFSEKKAPDKVAFDTSSFEQYEIYITKPRLDNIVSKYGEIKEKKDLPVYAGYFMKDIVEDMAKDWIELSSQANKYMFSKSLKFVLANLF